MQKNESFLPWRVEYNSRMGRHAVASRDIKAGELALAERPFIALPLRQFASVVCHRCLRPLQQQQHNNGDGLNGGNPCLPRHCQRCKELAPTKLDTNLASIRIKLLEIATKHEVDPLMLHFPLMLDLMRAGIPGAGAFPPDGVLASTVGISELQCTIEDHDALISHWDRKDESWRKKYGAALRAMYKELNNLAASDSIWPGYKPSPITRFQSDAVLLSAHTQAVGAVGTSTDTALGIFPALSVFQHSCMPNAWFTTDGPLVLVRVIIDVPAGTPLTVNYTGLTDTRKDRHEALRRDRQQTCSCERCSEPLEVSTDRFLQGMLCLTCAADVMLPLEDGPPNEQAKKEWVERVTKELEEEAARNARRAARGSKGSNKNGNKKGGAGSQTSAADNGTEKEVEDARGSKSEAEGAGGSKDEADAERSGSPNPADLPEGVMFWRCCNKECQAVEPAHNVNGTGPGDVEVKADKDLLQGLNFVSLKHSNLVAHGESLLENVLSGYDGRLTTFYHRYLEALGPLITINMRKGEAVKVINYSLALFDADRQLTNRPTPTQLRCLQTMIEATEAKATSASSAVVKRQFSKRLKNMMTELDVTRHALLGTPLASDEKSKSGDNKGSKKKETDNEDSEPNSGNSQEETEDSEAATSSAQVDDGGRASLKEPTTPEKSAVPAVRS